jgi:hypothetical protein
MHPQKAVTVFLSGATAIVILIAGAMITMTSRQAMATPDIAKATGQPCTQCHTSPPTLNDYGKKYQDSHKK